MTAQAASKGRFTEIALVALVVGVLTVLFAPIPSGLLDFLILANVSMALLVLMLTFYIEKPVEFSTFPSLLLIATLFRLSLNVAATRLILSQGEAGEVIAAVGSYVVGGNYVIGLIVFLILVVVQYVVVTNGAQRVAEVAARFTLDSMPGQQMSIDADLNMGFIDQEEAKRRRKNLERESSFYGAMDGASKFVKGDAIAGIVIMLINIIGGLVIGAMQLGMPWGQALRTYALLTIGDGIVTQVPALVIAVGTGIIVTRSASDGNLSQQALKQVSAFPKALLLVAVAIAIIGTLPGIPFVPVLLIATLLSAAALAVRRKTGKPEASATGELESTNGSKTDQEDLRVYPVEVQIGSQLASVIGSEGQGLMDRLAALRKQHAMQSGFTLPAIRFRDGRGMASGAYEISVMNVGVAKAELHLDKTLAVHGAEQHLVKGVQTRDPTYGLPAVWIDDDQKETARAARYTLVDPLTVLVTHVIEVSKQHAPALLTRGETDRLLNTVREREPGLVEELVPSLLSVIDIQKVLQHLLRESVSIRNLEAILESLADTARLTKDPAALAEAVRQRLGASICYALTGGAGPLSVLTLDPVLEQTLLNGVRKAEAPGSTLVVEPKLAEQLLAVLSSQCDRMIKSSQHPVLLCSPELRRHLRSLAERTVPQMRFLSMGEVPSSMSLKFFGSVAVS